MRSYKAMIISYFVTKSVFVCLIKYHFRKTHVSLDCSCISVHEAGELSVSQVGLFTPVS
jgi:hypothetical protein